MTFGWLNAFGAAIVVLLLIPNIMYALRTKHAEKPAVRSVFLWLEQIGRYGCIALMWLPLGVWKFGFARRSFFLVYLIGSIVLLTAYYVFWLLYAKRKTCGRALALSILPTALFLLCGVLLRHWLLAAFAVLFGVGHIAVCVADKPADD